MNSIGTVLELMISRRIVIFREICITSRAGKAEWWPARTVHLESVLFVFGFCFARGFSLEAEARLCCAACVGEFGRCKLTTETANLRKSSNANRSPIHPRLAPLKSRGAGGLLFEGVLFFEFVLCGWIWSVGFAEKRTANSTLIPSARSIAFSLRQD